ncbi:hypothetical protein WOLCODRAFT_162011 [Wolfiporia cocos MD-104 SS10]|uniref:Zinc-finger domain-containing protein n=1 Tax=Wolfiporia cocos (strain MD-104) TaxID=742152 RepID=A0A2H3JJE2_WOLCO|nr:hypothetical protein WOLCODRAFT_162011 [Wolfiporia cocos MD-104 SS10]
MPAVTASTPTRTAAASPVQVKSEPKEPEVRDLEEGEISEPEAAAAVAPPEVAPATTTSDKKKNSNNASLPNLPPIKTEPSLPTRMAQPPGSDLPATTVPLEAVPPAYPYVVDANHVRPGLAMTQLQYDTAKDIVLDLLGWGVPPEYLVSCGLSREIVYYVFTELNLRLPANLDITGIPPYEPPPPSAQAPSPHVVNMPQRLDFTTLQPQRSASVSRNHVPPTPQTIPHTEGSTSQTMSVLAPAFVPTTTSKPTVDPNLLDMEMQRRQELLARKAVYASRKQKQNSTGSVGDSPVATPATPASAESRDVEMHDSTKSVDDFLESIGRTSEKEDGTGTAPPAPVISPDAARAMDVDEPIPGLSGIDEPGSATSSSSSEASTRPRSTPAGDSQPSASTARNSPGRDSTPSSRSTPQRAKSDSPAAGSETDMDAVPGLLTSQSRSYTVDGTMFASGSRRGTKRPVAADFVDMDPDPSHSHSSNGQDGYHSSFYQPSARRKTGAFAGVSSMRRCVINLSDSEDDGSEDESQSYRRRGRPTLHHAASTLLQRDNTIALRPPSRTGSSMGIMSPASPLPVGSPAALREKEQEILRMKKKIAQVERETRLRKLAAASRSTPATPPESVASIRAKAPVKQEDDESEADLSLSHGSIANPHGHNTRAKHPALALNATPSVSTSVSASLPDSVNTSSAATPIDSALQTMQYPTTGDKVLTVEARQEQVVNGERSPSPLHQGETVGVISSNAETSAQVSVLCEVQPNLEAEQQNQTLYYSPYSSPLTRFFSLRAHLLQYLPQLDSPQWAAQHHTSSQGSTSNPRSASTAYIQALKMAHASYLLTDPNRRICQYEVPGGGECRDQQCEDIHLSRAPSAEPSDDEISRYLYALAVLSRGPKYSIEDLKATLQETRQRDPMKSFDDRISAALRPPTVAPWLARAAGARRGEGGDVSMKSATRHRPTDGVGRGTKRRVVGCESYTLRLDELTGGILPPPVSGLARRTDRRTEYALRHGRAGVTSAGDVAARMGNRRVCSRSDAPATICRDKDGGCSSTAHSNSDQGAGTAGSAAEARMRAQALDARGTRQTLSSSIDIAFVGASS